MHAVRVGATSVPGVVFVSGVVAGVVVRCWQVVGREMVLYVDSSDYVEGAQAPWLSAELWMGPRPPGCSPCSR